MTDINDMPEEIRAAVDSFNKFESMQYPDINGYITRLYQVTMNLQKFIENNPKSQHINYAINRNRTNTRILIKRLPDFINIDESKWKYLMFTILSCSDYKDIIKENNKYKQIWDDFYALYGGDSYLQYLSNIIEQELKNRITQPTKKLHQP